MKKAQTLQEQIERVKVQLAQAKCKSHRKVELAARLRELRLKQLQLENRIDKASAA